MSSSKTEALAASPGVTLIVQVKEPTPLGRIGEPADIADIVGFLVSEDARRITGQTLHAGGGLFRQSPGIRFESAKAC